MHGACTIRCTSLMTLSHAQAELLIALLVEAEAQNQDVDADPTFVPLFSHLDRCEDCLALYEATAEDFATTIAQQRGRTPSGDQKPSPVPAIRLPPMPSTYRTFEVLVHNPRHAARAALREQSSMYSATPHVNLAHVEATRGRARHDVAGADTRANRIIVLGDRGASARVPGRSSHGQHGTSDVHESAICGIIHGAGARGSGRLTTDRRLSRIG